jgi:crossover junction endodeoxyribonuclease RuvC
LGIAAPSQLAIMQTVASLRSALPAPSCAAIDHRILGIDPGATVGGWAVLDQYGQIVSAGDVPIAGTGAQRMVSAPLFAAIIDRFAPARAVIERVGPMPRQGVSSMFRFGRGLGVTEGVLGAQSVPISYVSPTVWKRHFGLGRDKEQARQKAIELWPTSAIALFGRRKDHGRAEACLITRWSLRLSGDSTA